MAIQRMPVGRDTVVYPETVGEPVAGNIKQLRPLRWIATIRGVLDILFKNDPDVLVAGNLLWYPIEGDNQTRVAPDVLVAFGRPKGDRGSYLQWREENIPPQVVFEVLLPANRLAEMLRKRDFYEKLGVEEYYLYDPDRFDLIGFYRSPAGRLEIIETFDAWVSPRLGIRFDVQEGRDMIIYGPDGHPFPTFVELANLRQRAEQERDQQMQRAERLEARLRELGIDPDAGDM